METSCDYCGKTIIRKPHFIKRVRHHYCNRECTSKGFRLQHEKTKTKKSECPQCGKPVYVLPDSHSKLKFCGENCYRKWRGKGPSVKCNCLLCGAIFYKTPGSPRKCCSKKCGYEHISKTKSSYVSCLNCGKSFKRWNSYIDAHPTTLCSLKCYGEYNKLSSSFSWKGGSYNSLTAGCVMILVGRYDYKSTRRAKCNLKYKRRHTVIAELFLDYELCKTASVLKINGSEQLQNIFVCQSHSEHIKMLKGSLPIPKVSNLVEIKKHQLCKATSRNYERLPKEWISNVLFKSFGKATIQ